MHLWSIEYTLLLSSIMGSRNVIESCAVMTHLTLDVVVSAAALFPKHPVWPHASWTDKN